MEKETLLINYVVERLLPLSGIIGTIIGLVWLFALSRMVRRVVNSTGSRFVLKYGWPIRISGFLVLAIGAGIAFVAFQSSRGQTFMAILVGGTCGAAGVYMALETFFVRIEFDDLSIYTFSPWRRSRRIEW